MLVLINLLCPCLLLLINKKMFKMTDDAPEPVIDFLCGGYIVTCVIWIVAFIATILLTISVSGLSSLNAKISLYEEENQKIEIQMNELTAAYMDYESDVFKSLMSESSINVAMVIPELKSNELVMSQLVTYKENNDQIKRLKEKQIDGKVLKWWLYFGG